MSTIPNEQLHIKSYFARSIQDAIELAGREMGPDALLLNSRPSPPEARHLGEFEIVFGSYPQSRPAEVLGVAPAGEIAGLRQQMDEIRNLLLRRDMPTPAAHSRQPLIERVLIDAGMEPGLAAEIEVAVGLRMSRRSVLEISRPHKPLEWDPDVVVEETGQEIGNRVRTQSELGRVTVLAGPPGAGKTTTLVKLAVSRGIASGRAVRLISADTQRIGAAEQLRTFAAILGVPFQSVESTGALAQSIDNTPANSMLLVDTPGLSPALLNDLGGDLAGLLSSRQDIDTHLVLTATARQTDLENAVLRFRMFRPSRLIFTRLDETDSLGAAFSVAARHEKPVSFFCNGQLIPEDIQAASKSVLVEALVRRLPEVLRAAA
jgi:flagellar biosynthesis protein FlhF